MNATGDSAHSPSSGRKSPDPFKRFRRRSSSNSLSLSSDSLTDASASSAASSSTVSAPPRPSSSSKPAFQRLHRARSTSISNISSVLGLKSKTTDTEVSQDTEHRQRSDSSRMAASSSGSQSQTLAASTPTSPTYQRSVPPSPTLSKQHRQAWYQSQQKTIDLEQRHNTSRQASNDSLFPMNVHAASRSPSQSSQYAVETFMSEDEMTAAGIHIIRRQSDKDVSSLTAVSPSTASPLLDGQHPDLLEIIASPTTSKASSPVMSQLDFRMTKSLTHTGSVRTEASDGSSDDVGRLNAGSDSELSLGQVKDSPQPARLSPAPSASASPFLNRHPASIGRAAGVSALGRDTQSGFFHYKSGPSRDNPASLLASSSTEVSQKPPKPPKPLKNFLSAFPRPGHGQQHSNSTSIHSEPTIREGTTASSSHLHIGLAGNRTVPPSSYTPANDFRDRYDADSVGPPPPPPRRAAHSQSRQSGFPSSSAPSSTPMMRAASAGGVVGALGHVGQLGAAMGRRGWDMMKTLQSTHAPAMSRGASSSNAKTSSIGAGYQINTASPFSSAAMGNIATQQWLTLLDRPNSQTDRNVIFGVPLKEAVLLSRLSNLASPTREVTGSLSSPGQLDIPDLGKDFGADIAESSRITPRASMTAAGPEPYNRQEARHLFLPRIVVRCIESLERWGATEEGIYRISGRSSHTVKLRAFFSDPREDLKLEDITPADLDINSVCSVLKSYLRELPTAIIPTELATQLDTAVSKLLAEEPAESGSASSGAGAIVRSVTAADQKAARLDPLEVETRIAPLVRQLPVCNWYLLREVSEHLGQLSLPTVVAQTKMPLSNLTLVLAPTLSISLPVLQVLVQQRFAVFQGPAPSGDISLGSDTGLSSRLAEDIPLESATAAPRERKGSRDDTATASSSREKPPKPSKPDMMAGGSKLPVLARRRASSISLSGLLNKSGAESKSHPVSPIHRTEPAADEEHQIRHSRTFSSSSGAKMSRLPTVGSPYMPPSPSFVHEPYERPSTSLGHFGGASVGGDKRSPFGRDFESRDIARHNARQYNALALDDVKIPGQGPSQQRRDVSTPIAQYYTPARRDSPGDLAGFLSSNEGALQPLLPMPNSASAVSVSETSDDTGSSLHQSWADKVNAVGSGGANGLSALDRPRPPTSSSASFFAGRSRRQDSLNGLASVHAPPGSSGVTKTGSRSRENSAGDLTSNLPPIAPLKIVKRTLAPAVQDTDPSTTTTSAENKTLRVQKSSDLSSSASSNTMSSAASTIDTVQSHHSSPGDDTK